MTLKEKSDGITERWRKKYLSDFHVPIHCSLELKKEIHSLIEQECIKARIDECKYWQEVCTEFDKDFDERIEYLEKQIKEKE